VGRGFPVAVLLGCAISIAILLSGCNGSRAPSPTPTESLALTATEIVYMCAEKMETVDSVHFKLTQVGGTTPIGIGLDVSEAAGDIVRPDKVKGEITTIMIGLPVIVKYITVGNITLIANPMTGEWEPFPGVFSAAGIFDPDIGIAGILRSMTNLSRLEDGKAAGFACFHIRGNVTSDDLRPITRLFTPSYLEGIDMAAEIWLDREDFLLRQIRLEGQITVNEKPGIIRTITISDYNKSVEIELPT